MPPRELIDGDSLSPSQRSRALRDLSRVNRLLFARGTAYRQLVRELAASSSPSILLDVGAGTGELIADVLQRAHSRGAAARQLAVDRQLAHLALGRDHCPRAWRVVADARQLPLRRGSVDIATSHLFFHHFGARGNRRVLREMRRAAKQRVLIVDLRRTLLSPWFFRIVAGLLRLGPVARADGLTSTRCAWPLKAVRRLVHAFPVRVKRRFPGCFSLEILLV